MSTHPTGPQRAYADETLPLADRIAAAEAAIATDPQALQWALYLKGQSLPPQPVQHHAMPAPETVTSLEDLQARIGQNQPFGQQPVTGRRLGEATPGMIPNRNAGALGIPVPAPGGEGRFDSQPAPLTIQAGESTEQFIARLEREQRWDQSLQVKTQYLHEQTIAAERRGISPA